jgi:hypothetical protein
MWYPKVKFKIKKIFNGRVTLGQLDWCGILPNITFHSSQIENKLIAIEISWLFWCIVFYTIKQDALPKVPDISSDESES